MTDGAIVGIIANPASGKDIRRLIAHGSSFDNNEKVNIVRRVLLGLDTTGVTQVMFLPDPYAIVERAAEPLKLRLNLAPLSMPVLGNASDSTEAAQRMADAGVRAIITLGGDGTNRVVSLGCGEVPLVPISTGTNNVFPVMVEGTLAGLAAGTVATGAAGNGSGDAPRVIKRVPKLDVIVDGEYRDTALIDVVTSGQAWIGARALWQPENLRDVVLARIEPAAIGMASLGGLLFPDACGTCAGAHIAIGDNTARQQVVAPLAPGLFKTVPIATATQLTHGSSVTLRPGPCVIALDGERELEILRPDSTISVQFSPRGPRVVEISAAIQAAARAGIFQRS